jgi:bifunctional DNA-binding transcriptional regulator/antitoxin component of YhaV-PrlF toxin-antitoxin module
MTIHKITSKHQITLRRDMLEHLGVRSGDRLVVEKLADGRIEVRAAKGKMSDVFGMLKRKNGPKLTIEQMNEVIADGWAGKRAKALKR